MSVSYDGRGRKFPIVIARGTDVAFSLTVTDAAGAPVNMSSATVAATIFTKPGASVVSFASAVSGAGSNVVTLSLTDTQTAALTATGYQWSLLVTRGGDKRAWFAGGVTVVDSDNGGGVTSGNRPVMVDSELNVNVGGIGLVNSDADVAGYVNDPASATTTALAAQYAPTALNEDNFASQSSAAPPTQNSVRNYVSTIGELRTARSGMSKGGAIGVGDKGVVAIRFDDGHDIFHASICPLLKERGLPASFASISGRGEQPWFDTTTWDNVREWNRNGVEIWSHGFDHKDPTPTGDAGLIQQIVTSKAQLEAQQLKVQGWSQPGATPVGPGTPYGTNFTNFQDIYSTRSGQLITSTYPLSEMYSLGTIRPIPCDVRHGIDHVTVSDGMSLANAKLLVDIAAQRKLSIRLMCHAYQLGVTGMSVADFTELLDYIVTAWEAGTIEVLTPSGSMFADRSNYRLDLMLKGNFETATTGDTAWLSGWSTKTVQTSGGRTGNNFLRIDSSDTTVLTQRYLDMQTMGLGGETFIIEGWGRLPTAGWCTSRFFAQDYVDLTRLNNVFYTTFLTTSWTRFRYAFTLHPNTDRLTLAFGRNSGSVGLDLDDITVRIA